MSDGDAPHYKLIITLPVFHAVISAIYLYYYCVGFGANVLVLVLPSDIFYTALRDVIGIYALSVAPVLVMTILRHSGKYAYHQDLVNDPANEKKRRALELEGAIARCSITIISVVALIASISQNIIAKRAGDPMVFIGYFLPAILLYYTIAQRFFGKFRYSAFTSEAAAIVAIAIIASMLGGAESGQSDRYRSYASYVEDYPHCDSYLVLRRMGDLLLSIGPEGDHALLSENCDIVMSIPA